MPWENISHKGLFDLPFADSFCPFWVRFQMMVMKTFPFLPWFQFFSSSMGWLLCAGAVLSHTGPKGWGNKLDLGEQLSTLPSHQNHWDKALLDVAFPWGRLRIQLLGVFAVLCSTSTLFENKNVFKDRSTSRSWVRINLCCSLLFSPDVLSKGKTVLSN